MGAERITEERKLPLFVSQTSGSTQLPLRRHEYVLYQVIHPPPLFHPKLCPTRGTLREDKRQIWANKNVTKTKKRENDRAVLFMSTQVLLWRWGNLQR